MDQETLFTAAKWEVLKALEAKSKSPIELAEISKTSISNISQSLRFLELAGLVKSERIGNREKGQPRVMYSLAKNNSYLIVTSENFVEKKQLNLDNYKKIILKIWFYKNEALHPYLEEGVRNIIDQLDQIGSIYFDDSSLKEIKLIIIPKENTLLKEKDFKETQVTWEGALRKITYIISSIKSKEKISTENYAIFDSFKPNDEGDK